jgi:type II secretory pathway pseudopilin PulG
MLEHDHRMNLLRRQNGFTLIEVLIAATLSIVVLGSTLAIMDTFNHQYLANSQRNDAQDEARLGIDRIVRQLRNIASPITTPKLLERATPYDVVFQTVGTPSGSNTSGDQRVRYCVPTDTPSGSAGNEVLISETQTWSTASPPASPWSSDPSVTLACPDSPLPSGVSGSTIVVPSVTNRYQGRTDRPLFSFNNSATAPTDLSQVTSVQIDLFVNPTPTGSRAKTESELRSAAFLRNEVRQPVAGFSWTETGGGVVLLNGGSSYSPDGYDLSYKWSCISAGCPNATVLSEATDGLIDWHPGATGSYEVQLTVTDPSGLTGTQQQWVNVT